MSEQAKQAPLEELLGAVPEDLRVELLPYECHSQLIPIGKLCRQAAAELAALRQRVRELEEKFRTQYEMDV